MAENENPTPKLKLTKNTDTNRFKVENSANASSGATPVPPMGADPGATQTIADPISLRDTATGRLRRISERDGNASAMAPGSQNKRETIRMKVVRTAPRPQISMSEGAHLNIPEATVPQANAARPDGASSTIQVPPPVNKDDSVAPMPPKPSMSATAAAIPRLKIAKADESASTIQVPPPQTVAVPPPEAAPMPPKPSMSATAAAIPRLKIAKADESASTIQVPPPVASATSLQEAAPMPQKPSMSATAAAIPRLKVSEPAGAAPASQQEAAPMPQKPSMNATAAAIPRLKVSEPAGAAPAPQPEAAPMPKKNLTATVVAMPRPRVGAAAPSRSEASAAAAAPMPQAKADPASSTIKLNRPDAAAPASDASAAGNPSSTVQVAPPTEQPKKLGLKLKKTEETKPAEPSLPPGLEAAGQVPPAMPSAPAPEQPAKEAKPDAAPSLKKKEEPSQEEVSQDSPLPTVDDGPDLLGGISAMLTFLGAACAMVFFVMILLGFLI